VLHSASFSSLACLSELVLVVKKRQGYTIYLPVDFIHSFLLVLQNQTTKKNIWGKLTFLIASLLILRFSSNQNSKKNNNNKKKKRLKKASYSLSEY